MLSTHQIFSEVEEVKRFPIEDCKTNLILDSTLQHKSKDEINMYSVGVAFYITDDWPIKTFIVKPLKKEKRPLALSTFLNFCSAILCFFYNF